MLSGNFFVDSGAAMSSQKDDWTTPRELFDRLDAMFGPFDLDAASSHENALCEQHYTVEDDALSITWGGVRVFCNPPYSKELGKWMRKAYEERNRHEAIVMLVPARTETVYWKQWVYSKADEVLFVQGRIAFGTSGGKAPFGSAVVVYRPDRIKTSYGTIEAEQKPAPL